MKGVVLALLVSGCGFSVTTTDPAEPGTDLPDGGVTSSLRCDTADPELRLCLNFDNTDRFVDATGRGHDAAISAVSMAPRSATDTAAAMSITSTMRIAESPDLDLPGDLTYDLWINSGVPVPGARAWLLDNNNQYFLSASDQLVARCGFGNKTIDAASALVPGVWHHLACTYGAASQTLVVFVDGDVSGCRTGQAPASITGHDGTAIGANLGPQLTERYTGLVDSVHIYGRTLAPPELCAAAGRSSCASTCPK